jgi:hypothetical protein
LPEIAKKGRNMKIKTFINNYREAFGEAAELPVVFWYSDEKIADTQ